MIRQLRYLRYLFKVQRKRLQILPLSPTTITCRILFKQKKNRKTSFQEKETVTVYPYVICLQAICGFTMRIVASSIGYLFKQVFLERDCYFCFFFLTNESERQSMSIMLCICKFLCPSETAT